MNKTSFSVLAALVVLATPVSALTAQVAPSSTVQVKKNQTIVDANGRVLGKVYEVNAAKGFASFMVQMKLYRVPLASLSADGSRLKTTMTRDDLGL
ncbi:MAG: hypothetical protein EOP62_02045 [Sphingomonadales bacterium]|nr:MAG: hypothetical protein EOP62_02045 [Sphingomonadales bacterium]